MTKTEFTAHKLAKHDQALIDQRLTDWDVRVLGLILSWADSHTGIFRRTQADLAVALNGTTRGVQRSRDRLVRFDYLEPIGKRRGGYVSGYRVVTPERRPCSRLPENDPEKATLQSPIGDPAVAQWRPAIRTNTSLKESPLKNLPSATLDTEPRGASPRLEGARPAGLGKLDAELRQRLGERFSLLSMARLLPSDDPAVVRLSALTQYQATQILEKCKADILAVAGASKIEFTVELTAEVFAR